MSDKTLVAKEVFRLIRDLLKIDNNITNTESLNSFFHVWIPAYLTPTEIQWLQEYRNQVGKEMFVQDLVNCMVASGRFRRTQYGDVLSTYFDKPKGK